MVIPAMANLAQFQDLPTMTDTPAPHLTARFRSLLVPILCKSAIQHSRAVMRSSTNHVELSQSTFTLLESPLKNNHSLFQHEYSL